MRILVVDDSLAWLEEAKHLMPSVELLTHIGPYGALFAAKVFRPDVILLDLNMPELDGKWLFSELKKSGAKIYFCSDSEPGMLGKIARTLGASGVITKAELRADPGTWLRKIQK